MDRKEFLKKSLVLGIGAPFFSTFLESCEKANIEIPEFEINFSGKVLIIGAGVAGLTAGYLLQQNNIDFEIIEASNTYGGRIRRLDGFTDFPIDLGAEWIHSDPSVLADIVNDTQSNAQVEFVTYNPKTIYTYKNGKYKRQNWVHNFYTEYKFKSTTWFGFFEKHIAPSVINKTSFNEPVNNINYSNNKVQVTSKNQTFTGDKVLVTVPIKILQNNTIEFSPNLPTHKTEAINNVKMEDGIKIFIEFKERFYPDIILFDTIFKNLFSDGKAFYDVAFGKDSSRNILGVFAINEDAKAYTSLENDQAIINKVLGELDQMLDGKATKNYLKHYIQNWNDEPYIQGSYSSGHNGNRSRIIETLAEPVNKKVYFAGEAMSDNNQATVHGACESAFASIKDILKD